MNLAAISLTLALSLAGETEPAPVVLLPGGERPFALVIEVADERLPADRWQTFVRRWFSYFDRDGDSLLVREEVARMFSLPLPGGPLTFDWNGLDADSNGRVMLTELERYCLVSGFTPVVMQIRPASPDDLELGARLAAALDADHNGRFDAAELRSAAAALRLVDANDDEYVSRDELLAGTASRADLEPIAALESGSDSPAATLSLQLGKASGATLSGSEQGKLELKLEPQRTSGIELHDLQGSWTLRVAPPNAGRVDSARGFLTAQFDAALQGRAALPLSEIDSDPALSGLAELASHADAQGDGELTAAELSAFFDLVDLGLDAQRWLVITDRGDNVFPALDRDGDDRLSPLELSRASQLVPAERTALPRQAWLTVTGVQCESWGGAPIPAVRKSRPRRAPVATTAPAWFQALDANGDGVVSRREFLGPAALFEQLDTSGDALLEANEASASSGP